MKPKLKMDLSKKEVLRIIRDEPDRVDYIKNQKFAENKLLEIISDRIKIKNYADVWEWTDYHICVLCPDGNNIVKGLHNNRKSLMEKHVRNKHPEQDPDYSRGAKKRKLEQSKLSFLPDHRPEIPKRQHELLLTAAAQFMCQQNLSFNAMESTSLLNLLQVANGEL